MGKINWKKSCSIKIEKMSALRRGNIKENRVMCNCESANGSIKINGSQMEILDGYYDDWDHYEIKFCPFCGESKEKIDKKCNFCLNPDSIISKGTCCSGCSVLREKNH